MENKYVGYLLIALSALIIVIIVMFNSALKDIVTSSCSLAHGDATSCPMYQSINQQTYIALGVVGLLILVSIFFIYSKPQKEIVVKKVETKTKKRTIDTSQLTAEEKTVLSLVAQNNAIFQADLIEKTGFGKAKMTRIIDRLEGKGIVERKRRGMTNVVVMKE